MAAIPTERSLDRRGRTITTFVVYDAATELDTMAVGDVLEIITDEFDPFEKDIAAWCDAAGHKLVGSFSSADDHRFFVEKGVAVPKDTRLAMVVSTDGLTELLSPLGFALAAALEGMEVSLFFQGPAVRVLKKGYHPKLRGWFRPFSRFAESDLSDAGHIPPQEKLRQMRQLGAEIYVCAPSMERFKVAGEDLIFDDIQVVEYLTFMAVMEQAGINMYI